MKKIVFLSVLCCCAFAQVLGDRVEFSGYSRAGVGSTNNAGDQVRLYNPGTKGNEFRLGHEDSMYTELILGFNLNKTDSKIPWKFVTRFDLYPEGHTTTDSTKDFNGREIYTVASNIFGKGYSYWIGKKFYRSDDIHFNDHRYYYDLSGNGAGIENIKTSYGNWNFVIMQEVGSNPVENQTNLGNATADSTDKKYLRAYDLQLRDVSVGEKGKLEFRIGWFDAPGGVAANSDLRNGWVVSSRYSLQINDNVKNDFAIIYGKDLGHQFGLTNQGADSQLSTYSATDSSTTGYRKSAWRMRIADQLMYKVSNKWTIHFAALYEKWSTGQNSDDEGTWWNVGARQYFACSDVFGLNLETGFSSIEVDGETNMSGGRLGERTMHRVTIAPTLRPNMDYWARPELRLYASYTGWNSSNKGDATSTVNGVGEGTSYHTKSDAITYGVQMEVWF